MPRISLVTLGQANWHHLGSATSGTISEPDPSRSVFKSTAQLDEAIFPILYRTLPFLKAMGLLASLEVAEQTAPVKPISG